MTGSGGDAAPVFGAAKLTRPLWHHQRRALAAFERDRRNGDAATYLVVPPGGGKTLVGLEAARRLGRPAVVLCPNSAIQAQWIAQWRSGFSPVTVAPTTSRDMPSALTVLTYQAVCTVEVGSQRGHGADRDDGLLSLLHPNGRALIERLRTGGPWTLVLDECHHLLELWGRLLRTVLAQLDHPHVIGLTATPPHMMTAQQADLHAALFGSVDLEVTAPALVRSGHLAPYQELVYFTRPTPPEDDYIHGEALRFAELRAGLLDPAFASTPFLSWLQARIVDRRGPEGAQVSWQRFERDEPALADAAVRLHTAGLLPLPDGARIREQHRQPPAAEDWVALIGDYCRRCLRVSGHPRDKRAYEAIRRALPSVGYRLTRGGVRASQSPVDRVLARSESKPRAVVEILRAESAELGARLRALVLCDFEEATGTLPARLTGVLAPEAGGARLVLQTLLADPVAAALDPVLLTGRTVACGEETGRHLLAWLRATGPHLDVSGAADSHHPGMTEITGASGWQPRNYVPLVTRFFTEGGSRCLIGTRALLGEGWDAPAVNAVVDLSAAATPTSVVQARGRALRLDSDWPGKVADNWGVVCVTGRHPQGAADYDRFVRKHDRYFALAPPGPSPGSASPASASPASASPGSASPGSAPGGARAGDVVSGVAHVAEGLSPYGPPPTDTFDARNAVMLQRAAERAAVWERWAVGSPYMDEPVDTVTVTAGRTLGLPRRVARPRARRQLSAWWPGLALLLGLAGLAVAVSTGRAAVGAAAGAVLLAGVIVLGRAAAGMVSVPSQGSLDDLALATADALRDAGLTSRGAESVRIEALADGSYRARLEDVPAGESEVFCEALEDVLSPLGQPRYVIPRLIVAPPHGARAALWLAIRRAALGRLPATVVYHAVPAMLGTRRELATTFERAWNVHVSPGTARYTGSPEGAGILAAQRGDDPFDVTTQIRTMWR